MPAENAYVDCGSILNRLYHSIDHQKYDDAISLFSEDGVYITPRGELVGLEAIRTALEARPVSQTTRHVITTFDVKIASDGIAHGLAYVQMYRATVPAVSGVVPIQPLEAIADLECSFRDGPKGWQISRVNALVVFAG